MNADDGSFDPHAELSWLTRALVGHLEWATATGGRGMPGVDAEWLEQRRQQYRALQLTEEELAAWTADAGAQMAPRSAAHAPPSQTTELRPELSDSPSGDESPAAPDRAPRSPAIAATTSAPTLDDAQPRALPLLEADVRGCTRCELHETRTNTVFARGTAKSGICFVGEGPGQDEDLQGAPFVGKAGQLLDRMIAAMGLERDDVYVCNIVKCRPPKNRKPLPAEMEACRPFLTEQLAAVQPKVIVALGATAVEGLLGLSMGITRLRGQWRLYRGQIPVMPTFHPAYLLRQPAAKREVWSDLQQVLEHLGMPPRPRS